jgi:predicted signal transduction protein with EAL and GGDEF domain
LSLPGGETLGLRASAGLVEVDDDESMTDAIARADRALYAAKSAGRDTWRWGDRRADPACAGQDVAPTPDVRSNASSVPGAGC